jgi:hypothetical protein
MADEVKMYPVSIVMIDDGFWSSGFENHAYLISARNEYEAKGKADAIAEPLRELWSIVDVKVGLASPWEPKKDKVSHA